MKSNTLLSLLALAGLATAAHAEILYFAGQNVVGQVNISTGVASVFSNASSAGGCGDGTAVMNGNVYGTCNHDGLGHNNAIVQINPTNVTSVAYNNTGSTLNGQLAIDEYGNFYDTGNFQSKITKATPNGSGGYTLSTFATTGGADVSNVFDSVTISGSGQLYASVYNTTPGTGAATGVYKVDSSGNLTLIGNNSVYQNFEEKEFLAADNSGDVFLANPNGLYEIAADGTTTKVSTNNNFRGIAYDSISNLLLAVNSYEGKLYEFNLSSATPFASPTTVILNASGSGLGATSEVQIAMDNGQTTVAPEPGTWVMLATGCGLVALVKRKRSQNLL